MPCEKYKKNLQEVNSLFDTLKESHRGRLDCFTPQQTLHFITFTLQPRASLTKGGSKQNAKMQFKKTHQHAKDALNFYTKNFTMIAELTKKGIIHYHAIAELNEDRQLAQALITDAIMQSKILGFHEIKAIKDAPHLQTCKDYLLKDYLITMQIINKTVKHEDDVIDVCVYHDKLKPATPKETNFLDRLITTYDNTECGETSRYILDFD